MIIYIIFIITANWSITNLRSAPPMRPSLLNTNSSSNNLSNSKRPTPTYEEDALVLRVIEAYCAAYQNNSRNTIHSGNICYMLLFFM